MDQRFFPYKYLLIINVVYGRYALLEPWNLSKVNTFSEMVEPWIEKCFEYFPLQPFHWICRIWHSDFARTHKASHKVIICNNQNNTALSTFRLILVVVSSLFYDVAFTKINLNILIIKN
jgi:hypothetical protein